jgi:hypothetical protein
MQSISRGSTNLVAKVALFLAGHDSRFVSGAGIAIDGAAGVHF